MLSFMQFLHVLQTTCEDPFASMAFDESLLFSSIAQKRNIPILRFYRFPNKAITIGFSQRDRHFLDQLDFSGTVWVRRLTGGGLVIHDGDLIFSLTLSKDLRTEFNSARSAYCAIHRVIQAALKRLHVETVLQKGSRAEANYLPGEMVCFERPVCDDLMLNGRKLVGGAEKHSRGYLLHQGSIQYHGILTDAMKIEEAISLSFEEKFNWFPKRREATSDEEALKRELEQVKYRLPNWNFFARVNSDPVLADLT